MEACKIIFLSKWVICRFHVNLSVINDVERSPNGIMVFALSCPVVS